MKKDRRYDEGLLKISEIAEKANVLTSTIRHYTDLGLIKVTEHTDGGHRLYDELETLDTLAKIAQLSKRGMTLPDIKFHLSGEQRKHILVVDDEVEVTDFIEDLLQDHFKGKIRIVHDGFAAGRALTDFLPDLVLLDLHLPGLDGFQVCRNIRADQELKGVRILAITGYDTPENAQKILASGADAYLAKPLEAKALLEKIDELLKIPRSSKAA